MLGHIGRQLGRGVVDLSHCDRNLRLTREGALAGEALVGDDAERVDVGRGGGSVAACLLGCQVLHRTHDLTGGRQRHLVGNASDAEVGDLDAALGRNEQVARLDVTVHQASVVRGLQRGGGLGHDAEYAISRDPALALDDRGKRFARDELHHDVGRTLLFTVIKHVRDALVVDERSVTGLSPKTLEKPGVSHVLVLEDFDRDGTTNDAVARLPNLAHAANGDP